ncbi:MAG: hypothetical protein HY071_06465 [Chloroflexi bacterium]|nr:hypothetical protein [Chloroflexota bacterium]
MRGLPLVGVILSLVACGSGAARAVPAATASATHDQHAATPSATPLINVDDMMGFFANQQTVFVVSDGWVRAVTLLNHDVRYEIAVGGPAQVAVDQGGTWLYVLDLDKSTGTSRLRTFDVAAGSERARATEISGVASDRRALAAVANKVYVLKTEASDKRSWVDSFEALTLKPAGTIAEKAGCADRLLATVARIALVCRTDGTMAVGFTVGGGRPVDRAFPGIAGATMADDGTIYVVTSAGALAAVPSGSDHLADLPLPSDWIGTVLPDTLVATGGYVVLAQQANVPYARMWLSSNMAQRRSWQLSGTPQGGMLALWPFAYFTVDRSVRHIDLGTGALETMTDIGANAMLGAIASK